ncbi:MAG: sulfurtransferase complex subunit TusB [Gallionella sp.]|jgi:tRNA 2-thiouridine synthesizing protein B|nr:sulfurtransferase complex subunit TusB [Gallionella sp.]
MLHIINKSPSNNSALENCLSIAASGEILLIEDAVYAATKGNAFEAKLRDAMGHLKVYVLQPDLDARGMGDRLVEGVTAVDYGGFVDLTISNNTCQSWL